MQIKYISTLLLVGSLLCCKHNREENICQEQLNRSRNYLNEFYLTNDSDYLAHSKFTLDSIDCDSFKHRVSNIKLSLYYLMKDYENGIMYVETLEDMEFQRPYMKAMFLNNFKALLCIEKKDTTCYSYYYKEIITEIEDYLDENKDIDALVDLYVFKSKIYPKAILLSEIDTLKAKGQYNHDYLNALYESVNNGIYSQQ